MEIHGQDQTTVQSGVNCPGTTDITSFLPYVVTVDITLSNWCDEENNDGVAFNYANQHVDIPSDSRCSGISCDGFDQFNCWRCIIAINP